VAILDDPEDEWLSVIGRALAFLSLHTAELRDKEIGEQAEFMEALGLKPTDIAPLIGSTEASVQKLLQKRRKKSKQGGKGGGKAGENAKPARGSEGRRSEHAAAHLALGVAHRSRLAEHHPQCRGLELRADVSHRLRAGSASHGRRVRPRRYPHGCRAILA
jgi:hypothetical protein